MISLPGHLRSVALVGAVVALLALPSVASGQEPIADSILSDPQTNSMELVSDSVAEPLRAIDDEFQAAIDRSSGWTRIWVSGRDILLIDAYRMASVEDLEGLIAGSLSSLPGQTQWMLPDRDGVVAWTEVGDGTRAEVRLFAEGTTAYYLSSAGPNSEQVLQRALNAQLGLATGDRYPITIDLATTLARSAGAEGFAFNLGALASRGLILIGLITGVLRLIRGKSKQKERGRPLSGTPESSSVRRNRVAVDWDNREYTGKAKPPNVSASPPVSQPSPTTKSDLTADPFGS